MTATAPTAAPTVPRPSPRPPRRSLAAAPEPRGRAPRARFVVLVLALLGGGLVGLLLLNTALAQGAFTVNDLQRQNVLLTEHQQAVQRTLEQVQQPGNLAARARALGMVPGGTPAFLQVPGGKVLGVPHVATTAPAAAAPAPVPAPTAAPGAKANPKPSTAAKPSASAKPAPSAKSAKPGASAKPAPSAKATTPPSAKATTPAEPRPTATATAPHGQKRKP